MAFITSNGLTESETSRTAQAGGITVHYHDTGAGDPALFMHSYGPGTTAWITVALLNALSIPRAHFVGNSQGGQSSMVVAMTYPDRVSKFVMGGSHIGTGGDRYLMANRPSEGSRATREALADPTREN